MHCVLTLCFHRYYDPRFSKWGSLRVINEDRVEPYEGWVQCLSPPPGHYSLHLALVLTLTVNSKSSATLSTANSNSEEPSLFHFLQSLTVDLSSRDSMGNVEVLKRGDLQLTSAGTGIRHSEKTYGSSPVHFLQIWSLPQGSGLAPKYFTRHFTDAEKTDRLVTIVAPVGSEGASEEREGDGPAPVQSPLYLYATLLSKGASVTHKLRHSDISPGQRKAYVHVIQTSGYNTGKAKGNRVLLNSGLELAEGDGAFAIGEGGQPIEIKNVGDNTAEVLLFDLD